MEVDTIVTLLAALIGASGIAGGVAVYRKVPAEKESIIISSAQGALVVQAGVLEDLREELQWAQQRIEAVEAELHAEIDRLRKERDDLRRDRDRLRVRVRDLEKRLDEIDGSNGS